MINLTFLFEDAPEYIVPPEQHCPIININGDNLIFRCMKPSLNNPDEKRPAILFLHGFPGNENFRDLAQAFRRCGFVVCIIFFRGVWGSGGVYRLSQLSDDAAVVIDYMKAHSDEMHVDPERIYVIGHSMGGFAAMGLLSRGIDIKGAVLLAPCDIVKMYTQSRADFDLLNQNAEPYFNLGEGVDRTVFCDEINNNIEKWAFSSMCSSMRKDLPILFVGASRDVTCPPDIHIEPSYEYLKNNGFNVEKMILDSDHCFQSVRIALTRTVAEWLNRKEVI